MTEHITDIVALLGLITLSVGVYLLSSLGWALVALGSGLYATSILTEIFSAAIANRRIKGE